MDWAERIDRRIKLRDLQILMAVAEWGSMAKAANRLSISHPVISKTIAELEQTLGVRLLDRSVRGVTPTDYGRALLKCGVAVFDEVRQGLSNLEFLANPTAGDLRIGCPEAMPAGVLPLVANRFSARCPGGRVHVLNANTAASQFGELRERNVDLLLGSMPSVFDEVDLAAEPLFDEPFVVVGGAQSPWARRRKVELRELSGEPWVLAPPDTVPGRIHTEIFHAHGLAFPRASILALSIHLTIAMVATGKFLAFLPVSVARLNTARAALKILPVKPSSQRVTVGIITVKNRTITPLAQLFIECAREVSASLKRPLSIAVPHQG
jgi:DNA-binding transcriptional LysR family regulator